MVFVRHLRWDPDNVARIARHQVRSLPQFSSREEEAEFWDTHDFSDYWDELQPIEVRFADKLSQTIALPLDPAAMGELRKQARARNTDPTALALEWVLAGLELGRVPRRQRGS
jgi:predicted glycoside hydrolase/deacetylase ChbG (UPF0249 family)